MIKITLLQNFTNRDPSFADDITCEIVGVILIAMLSAQSWTPGSHVDQSVGCTGFRVNRI